MNNHKHILALADALTVTPASAKPASDAGIVFKITLKS